MTLKEKTPTSMRLLVIDDDTLFHTSIKALLEPRFVCDCFANGESGLAALSERDYDLILLDLTLDYENEGFDILEKIRAIDALLPVVIVSKRESPDVVVKAMRLGATDFLGKSFYVEEIDALIKNSIREKRLKSHVEVLRTDLSRFLGSMMGNSPAIREVFAKIEQVAPAPSTVLIWGESGTGKELAAREIHQRSGRQSGPLLPVNCAAIPEELVESELFGIESHVATNVRARPGRFELAAGGTLFLDEVSELSRPMQMKLLRVIQEKAVCRVGSRTGKERKVDFRLICASSHEPRKLVEEQRLMPELYYRLAVFELHLPPLRERAGDVLLLARHFMEKKCREMGRRPSDFGPEAADRLRRHSWPGNVRELENCIERVVIEMTDGEIPAELIRVATDAGASHLTNADYRCAKEGAGEDFERQYLTAWLNEHDGNMPATARTIGISVQYLRRRVSSLGIRPEIEKAST